MARAQNQQFQEIVGLRLMEKLASREKSEVKQTVLDRFSE